MTFLHRAPVDESTADATDTRASSAESVNQVPLTRAGAAWIGLSAMALVAILLIIFLAQNTHQVRVNFLWMSTSTSLALMLLIAAVGSVLATTILGTARILQLRRFIRGGGVG
jgi:uncharacterized integral membrane protein